MKKPINRFLLKTLLFALPVLIFFEVLFRLGFSPIITNSTLFDQKMLAFQKHRKKVLLMSVGSSVGLYELNSKIIVQNFNIPYYNFSSWGLQITDSRVLLESFVKKYRPKYVLFCSSSGDFVAPQNDTYLNYVNASDLIKDDLPELFYFKNYNSIHQVIRRKFNTYPLVLDDWGGASLTVKQNNSNGKNEDPNDVFPTRYTAENYKALHSIGAFLKEQKVAFIFIQAPLNSSYLNTDDSKRLLSAHFDECKSIVERNGGVYLNYNDPAIFTSDLFIDQYHLRDTGSMIFTRKLVSDLGKILK
jgi:hypothetical protein